MIIKNEELQNKSSHPIIADYDQELQELWREKLRQTDSNVLCEDCNHVKGLSLSPRSEDTAA